MPEFIASPLPHFINQFETGRSQYRCAEASEVMCADFAYPRKFNLQQTMHDEYVRNCGEDIPSNQQGTSKEQVLDFFKREGIGYIDMQVSDVNALFAELEAQNEQGYIQFLTISDESYMIEYGSNKKMHSWADQGLHHCIVRLGCNSTEPYGLYYDPAASPFCYDASTGKSKAVKVGRDDIEKAGVMSAICIMKPGVKVPPADFSFQHNVWPVPAKPPLDVDKAEGTITAMMQALDAMKVAMGNLGNDLGSLKTEEAKEA